MVTLFRRLESVSGAPYPAQRFVGFSAPQPKEAGAVRFERTASFPPGLEAWGEPNTTNAIVCSVTYVGKHSRSQVLQHQTRRTVRCTAPFGPPAPHGLGARHTLVVNLPTVQQPLRFSRQLRPSGSDAVRERQLGG
jgi:hypothetical protein